MPMTTTYFVKRDAGLFRKARWQILMDKLKIAEHDTEEAALADAVAEAERSAELGRACEVWANNGEGFVHYRSFQPVKKKKGGDEDDEGPREPREIEDDSGIGGLL